MSGDTHEGLRSSLARQHEIRGRDDVADRLADLERANQELQERLRRYEHERAGSNFRSGAPLPGWAAALPWRGGRLSPAAAGQLGPRRLRPVPEFGSLPAASP